MKKIAKLLKIIAGAFPMFAGSFAAIACLDSQKSAPKPIGLGDLSEEQKQELFSQAISGIETPMIMDYSDFSLIQKLSSSKGYFFLNEAIEFDVFFNAEKNIDELAKKNLVLGKISWTGYRTYVSGTTTPTPQSFNIASDSLVRNSTITAINTLDNPSYQYVEARMKLNFIAMIDSFEKEFSKDIIVVKSITSFRDPKKPNSYEPQYSEYGAATAWLNQYNSDIPVANRMQNVLAGGLLRTAHTEIREKLDGVDNFDAVQEILHEYFYNINSPNFRAFPFPYRPTKFEFSKLNISDIYQRYLQIQGREELSVAFDYVDIYLDIKLKSIKEQDGITSMIGLGVPTTVY